MTALLVISYLPNTVTAVCKYRPITAKKNQFELILKTFWRRLKAPLAGTVADVEQRSRW